MCVTCVRAATSGQQPVQIQTPQQQDVCRVHYSKLSYFSSCGSPCYILGINIFSLTKLDSFVGVSKPLTTTWSTVRVTRHTHKTTILFYIDIDRYRNRKLQMDFTAYVGILFGIEKAHIRTVKNISSGRLYFSQKKYKKEKQSLEQEQGSV